MPRSILCFVFFALCPRLHIFEHPGHLAWRRSSFPHFEHPGHLAWGRSSFPHFEHPGHLAWGRSSFPHFEHSGHLAWGESSFPHFEHPGHLAWGRSSPSEVARMLMWKRGQTIFPKRCGQDAQNVEMRTKRLTFVFLVHLFVCFAHMFYFPFLFHFVGCLYLFRTACGHLLGKSCSLSLADTVYLNATLQSSR